MPSTIEVPISLIKAGDMDSIRELLPKPNLFGRWAEHPEYGRGIINSIRPNQCDTVVFTREREDDIGTEWSVVPLKVLTLDPVELTSLEDYENAPEGTIVADSFVNAYQKADTDEWVSVNDELSDSRMAFSGPWKILRWGWGEQQ